MNNHRKLSILKLALASTFAVGTALSGVNANAATTGNLEVGATVADACEITGGSLAFAAERVNDFASPGVMN